MDNHNGATKSPTGKAATVPALLDLDAALEEFSSVVTPLLKVGGETNWDGPQFLAREQAILQSALVLAGQCIALLFADVVSSPQVQQTARERTRPLRQPTSVGHGQRRVNITLIGGVRVPLLVEYIVARNPRKRRGRPRQRRAGRPAQLPRSGTPTPDKYTGRRSNRSCPPSARAGGGDRSGHQGGRSQYRGRSPFEGPTRNQVTL